MTIQINPCGHGVNAYDARDNEVCQKLRSHTHSTSRIETQFVPIKTISIEKMTEFKGLMKEFFLKHGHELNST